MKISTRMQVRPAFEEVLNSAREIKAYAPQRRVIFTVYDMKRLGPDAAELTAHDTVLEMFAGLLPRHLRRTDPGRLLFPFFAVTAEPSSLSDAHRSAGETTTSSRIGGWLRPNALHGAARQRRPAV
ncbi:hypothetical protein ACFVXA_39385 [Streptomyces sp. NPDC058246]|uniref:hypothetical protein n=1 Tax=Streptomyces sp. NPDC058246 TaxID=3346400 RepID=UPI0036E11B06